MKEEMRSRRYPLLGEVINKYEKFHTGGKKKKEKKNKKIKKNLD